MINTLCRPTKSPSCRKSCALYRAISKTPDRQLYADLNTGDGLRCAHRIDINEYPASSLRSWQDVDFELRGEKA